MTGLIRFCSLAMADGTFFSLLFSSGLSPIKDSARGVTRLTLVCNTRNMYYTVMNVAPFLIIFVLLKSY